MANAMNDRLGDAIEEFKPDDVCGTSMSCLREYEGLPLHYIAGPTHPIGDEFLKFS